MRLGLIAGNGRFPFLVLEAARAQGHDVTIVAAAEEASPDLTDAAARLKADIHWISLGHLGRCIGVLQKAGVTQAVMAGQVKHTKIFSAGIVPDLTLLSVLTKLRARNTDGLIGAVAKVLSDHGIELIDSTALIAPLLARTGVLTRRAPSAAEQAEFAYGYRIADAIAADATEPSRHCCSGLTSPRISPGNSMLVSSPNPNFVTYSRSFTGPSRCPSLIAPTLLDSATT